VPLSVLGVQRREGPPPATRQRAQELVFLSREASCVRKWHYQAAQFQALDLQPHLSLSFLLDQALASLELHSSSFSCLAFQCFGFLTHEAAFFFAIDAGHEACVSAAAGHRRGSVHVSSLLRLSKSCGPVCHQRSPPPPELCRLLSGFASHPMPMVFGPVPSNKFLSLCNAHVQAVPAAVQARRDRLRPMFSTTFFFTLGSASR
jgi:hypothetical protein